ncbi:MAG: hypothetical protein NZM38_07825 [Cytophagales bacterium]|nr:hypothetical protein [Cytophagales bacterium]MDW8384665.1 hypothetical protein [Flammeovirgaceae bacterium]
MPVRNKKKSISKKELKRLFASPDSPTNQTQQRKEESKQSEVFLNENFKISKKYAYTGPNYYLGTNAYVFNLSIFPNTPPVEAFLPEVTRKFPRIAQKSYQNVAQLFAAALIEVLKMDIDLYINRYDITMDGEDYVIAVEYLDDITTEEAVYLVADWFYSIATPESGFEFDIDTEFAKLQKMFDRSPYGGPTIYSMIEAALKRNIPVNFLEVERQFQWGYGKKQIRGSSTVLDVDGIKDTEFTTYKDACKDFLLMCGFPTPRGKNTFTEEEAIQEAIRLGFPLVVKPLAGHKGEGVTTNIETLTGVKEAFQRILKHHQEHQTEFQGAIVEQQIYGNDHRLLAIGGKFVAALERVPPYVIGDGVHTIAELIKIENETNPKRYPSLRSPLSQIVIDDNMIAYLATQNLTLESVPEQGKQVFLRKVANISAGGVSINVTHKIHPKNVRLVENIASFFRVTAMGIDVLTADISKPWTDGNFGIIEINAGPGVFMHLCPAIGEPIDVPGRLIEHFFPTPEYSRIPIIVGNKISYQFSSLLYKKLKEIHPDLKRFGSLTDEGIYFNDVFFTKNPRHDINVQIILRHIELDFALIQHTKDDIHDFGTYHTGADIVILEDPYYAETTLATDVLPGGYIVKLYDNNIDIIQNEQVIASYDIDNIEQKDEILLKAITPLLKPLINKYEIKVPRFE